MNTLIERLEAVMKEMGWERDDLVRISGQSSSVVSQWLGKGAKIIKTIGKMEAAEKLADASGYSALWIAKGMGEKKQTHKAASAIDWRTEAHNLAASHPRADWREVLLMFVDKVDDHVELKRLKRELQHTPQKSEGKAL
jgi:transcriptional regulator with XRE-family HTH domain